MGEAVRELDNEFTVSCNRMNLKYGAYVYSKSLLYSDEYVAGSENAKDDLTSFRSGFVGAAHNTLGREVFDVEFSKYRRYKNSLLLSISINFDTL